jgi:hypothetical protein
MLKETLIKWLRVRIAALRGTRNLAVYRILSWFLRSVRLWRVNNALQRIYSTDTPFTGALHPARSINQCFLKNAGAERIIGFFNIR